MRSRLYLQIYATVFLCLVAVAVAAAISFAVFTEDGPPKRWQGIAEGLIERILPDPDATIDKQTAEVQKILTDFGMDFAVYSSQGVLITGAGKPMSVPVRELLDEPEEKFNRWRAHYIYHANDGRIAVARPYFQKPDDGLAKLFGTLVLIIIAVLLAAFPLVRRLTRRLETFHQTVERAGDGDLSARVSIKGKDEIAKLALAYNTSADRIERLVESNKMLLANASHELRTPLSRIRLGVEMVRDGGSPKRLEALQVDISELDDLIDEILLMSRLENSANRMTFEPVDLLALAAEECARFDACSLDGSPVELNADPRLLRRMIRNLLTNAHRHGKPPVEFSLTHDGQSATITVSDHGDGIADTTQKHIFEPFFRGQGKQNVAGYGLGLALVRQIAQSHGGTISLDKTYTEGARFIVVLPLHHTSQQSGGE